MKNEKLLENLSKRYCKGLQTKRYNLADMISESYNLSYDCKDNPNLKKLIEGHIENIKTNPREIEGLSRQLCVIKELARLEESGKLRDSELVENKSARLQETKKPCRMKRVNEASEEDTELTDKELEEITKHLNAISKERKNPAKKESIDESADYEKFEKSDLIEYIDDKYFEDMTAADFHEMSKSMIWNKYLDDHGRESLLAMYAKNHPESVNESDEEMIKVAVGKQYHGKGLKPEYKEKYGYRTVEIPKSAMIGSTKFDKEALVAGGYISDDESVFYVDESKSLKESHGRTAALSVTIGVEVSVEKARSEVEYLLGIEYDDSLTDEECLEIWADDEFNQGLGCDVSILDLRESVEDFDTNKGKELLTDVKDEVEGKEDRVIGKRESCNESKKSRGKNLKESKLSEGLNWTWFEDQYMTPAHWDAEAPGYVFSIYPPSPKSEYDGYGAEVLDDQHYDYVANEDFPSREEAIAWIEKNYVSKSTNESKKMRESKSYRGLQEFAKKSSGKAFYKTFKKLNGKLHEGKALSRQESIDLYKAANSAMTQMSIELEHNPKFIKTFKESSAILSADVNRLLESLSNNKAPSKKNMQSLAKFSEALLNEDHIGGPSYDEFEKLYNSDPEVMSKLDYIAQELGLEDGEDPTEEEARDILTAYYEEFGESRKVTESEDEDEEEEITTPLTDDDNETPGEDFVGDDEGDIESDSSEFDADIPVSGDTVSDLTQEYSELMDRIQSKKEELQMEIQSLDSISDMTPQEDIANDIEGDIVPDPDSPEEFDDEDPEEEEITDDELEELKNHLREMRATKKLKESEDVDLVSQVKKALDDAGIKYTVKGRSGDRLIVDKRDLEKASAIRNEIDPNYTVTVQTPA